FCTYVSPGIVLLIEVKDLCIIGSSKIRTVLALARSIHVLDVPAVGPKEIRHVFSAGKPRRRVESRELLGSTLDLDVPDDRTQEPSDEVVERVEIIYPVLPERLHESVRDDNAAEGDHAASDE